MGKISILGSWYLNRACLLIAWELDLVGMVSCRSDTPLGLVKRVCAGCCVDTVVCDSFLPSGLRLSLCLLPEVLAAVSSQLIPPLFECPSFVVAASQFKSSPCLALLLYSCCSGAFPSESTHKGSWGAQAKASNFKLAFQRLYAT